jgi:hypothetical protein
MRMIFCHAHLQKTVAIGGEGYSRSLLPKSCERALYIGKYSCRCRNFAPILIRRFVHCVTGGRDSTAFQSDSDKDMTGEHFRFHEISLPSKDVCFQSIVVRILSTTEPVHENAIQVPESLSYVPWQLYDVDRSLRCTVCVKNHIVNVEEDGTENHPWLSLSE